MKIVGLRDITRKETFIYYRREFQATADIEVLQKKFSSKVDFVIEQGPLGKDVHIKLEKSPDYPVLPIIKSLKSYIIDMDGEGKLP